MVGSEWKGLGWIGLGLEIGAVVGVLAVKGLRHAGSLSIQSWECLDEEMGSVEFRT